MRYFIGYWLTTHELILMTATFKALHDLYFSLENHSSLDSHHILTHVRKNAVLRAKQVLKEAKIDTDVLKRKSPFNPNWMPKELKITDVYDLGDLLTKASHLFYGLCKDHQKIKSMDFLIFHEKLQPESVQ